MKTFRLLTTLLVVVLCIGFNSCSKDDDGDDSIVSIVGNWAEKPSDEQFFISFNADGTGSWYCIYEGTKEESLEFTYILNEKTMLLTTIDEEGTKESTTIQLSETILIAGDIIYYRQ